MSPSLPRVSGVSVADNHIPPVLLRQGPSALRPLPPGTGVEQAGPENVLQALPPAARQSSDSNGTELSAQLPALLPRLWRFALRLAGDRHDAEDLVQRACVRALERSHQFRAGTSALSWMFAIMNSVWLNEVRARQIRRHASIQLSEELIETVADAHALDPEQDALHRQILAAVARLPDANRTVMLLVAVEGLSYREAAEALDVPVGTVMSRLARARLAIGQAFGNRPGEAP
jgi:RNA polymerase sigma-70 factor, ECF subfamily